MNPKDMESLIPSDLPVMESLRFTQEARTDPDIDPRLKEALHQLPLPQFLAVYCVTLRGMSKVHASRIAQLSLTSLESSLSKGMAAVSIYLLENFPPSKEE